MKMSSRHRPVVGPVALGALALLAPCRVVAQTSSDHEVAVAEFREARRLIDANDCAAALVRLERSLAREPSIGARMSMAECQEKGEPVKAWRSLSEASVLAYTNHDDRLAQIETRMVQIERLVGTFHLGLAPADLVRAGLDVRIDGQPVDRFLLRRGIVAVEAGEHVVEATAPDRAPFSVKAPAPVPGSSVLVPIVLAERASAKAPPPATHPAPPQAAPSQAAPSQAAPPRAHDDAKVTRRAVGLSLGAVGVVGLAVGSVFGLVALGRGRDLDDACGGDRERCSVLPGSVESIRDAGLSAATASTVSFVVGGAALAGGIAILVWPSKGDGARAGSSAALRMTPTGIGLGGAF
ncbi:MAG: hypothetical protein JST00_48175 [Deltaproteobacteria bacterium]|nr:hypothetical protein [Deltaproteobacteria bacterium]